MAGRKRHEGHNTLPLHLVGAPDHRGFRHRVMTDERTFHFHGSDAMTRHIDDVVNTTHDPEVTVFIATCTVPREVHAWNIAPVLTFESFGIAIDCPHHGGPGLSYHKIAAFIRCHRLSLAIHH